eukprot:751800-Hanusia_phi.AAC.1
MEESPGARVGGGRRSLFGQVEPLESTVDSDRTDMMSSVELGSPGEAAGEEAASLVRECVSQKFEILRTPERSLLPHTPIDPERQEGEAGLGIWHDLIAKTSPSRSSIEEALKARNSISLEDSFGDARDMGGRESQTHGNNPSEEVKRACEIMADRAKQDMIALERDLLEFTREMELNFLVEKTELTSMYEDQVWRLKQDVYYASQKECQLLEELDEMQKRNQALQDENKELRQSLLESRLEAGQMSEDLQEASNVISQMTSELDELSEQKSSNFDRFESETKSMTRKLFIHRWETDRLLHQVNQEVTSAEDKLIAVERNLKDVHFTVSELRERNAGLEHALRTAKQEIKFLSFKVQQKSEECLKLQTKNVDDISTLEHHFDLHHSAQLIEMVERTSSSHKQAGPGPAVPQLADSFPAHPDLEQHVVQDLIRDHDQEVQMLRDQLESIYAILDQAKYSETLLFPFMLEIYREFGIIESELEKIRQDNYRYFKHHVRSNEVGMSESVEILREIFTNLFQVSAQVEMVATGKKNLSFALFDLLLNALSDFRLANFRSELHQSCQQFCHVMASGLDNLVNKSSTATSDSSPVISTPVATHNPRNLAPNPAFSRRYTS